MFLLLSIVTDFDSDPELFVTAEYLYENYYAYIKYQLLKFMPNCYDDVDDIVQEIFVSIIKNEIMLNVNDKVGIKNYLKILCRNKAIDYSKEKDRSIYIKYNAVTSQKGVNTTPEQKVLSDEGYDELTGIILSLDQQLRDICWLKFIMGYKNKEIAKTLGISEGNVAVGLHRARREIRIKYEKLKKRF